MSDLTVARTIAQQMGGTGRLKVMVGAHDFLGDDNSLQFSFKGSRKMNKCRVVLDFARDTYTIEFWRITNTIFKKVSEFEDVYFDMLVGIFEDETGLYLSL